MLDIKTCPGCGRNTAYNNEACPYCGHRFTTGTSTPASSPAGSPRRRCPNCNTPITGNRSYCPNCRAFLNEKSVLSSYLLIAAFIGVVIILAVFVFHVPGAPATVNASQAVSVTAVPTVPSCNIAITGQKLPSGKIELRLMAKTCGPDDVRELRVLVNNKDEGVLKYQLGAMGTYPGHTGGDTVDVIARFSSGYEKNVFDSTYA
jgi:RNA polymerase subunit RPABC4/transcription elongation factor Spt4